MTPALRNRVHAMLDRRDALATELSSVYQRLIDLHLRFDWRAMDEGLDAQRRDDAPVGTITDDVGTRYLEQLAADVVTLERVLAMGRSALGAS